MASHDIMTIEEVADYLRVSERTVYEWAQKGSIPAGKLGTAWRFRRQDIERWVGERLNTNAYRRPAAATPISEILTPERVILLELAQKSEVLDALVERLATASQIKDQEELRREIFRREELMSTGIGFGVAVPHVRLTSVEDLTLAVGIAQKDVLDYASLDEQPVRIVCMLAARFDQHAQYLKALGAISGLLRDKAVRTQLINAPDAETAYKLLTEDGG